MPQLCEYLNQICWYNIHLQHTNVPPVFLQEQLCWWAELLIWFLSEKITIITQNSNGKHSLPWQLALAVPFLNVPYVCVI